MTPDLTKKLAAGDPDFAAFLNGDPAAKPARKSQPGATDVHVASARGNKKNGKKKPPEKPPAGSFAEALKEHHTRVDRVVAGAENGDPPPTATKSTFNDIIGGPAGGDMADAAALPTFYEIMTGQPLEKRDPPLSLKTHPDGGAHTPFPHDAQALDKIPQDQMRRFLSALTDQDSLPQKRVAMSSLVAIQPRVSPGKVEDMRTVGYAKLPLVVRLDGKNYIADGNHRAAASYLDGEDKIDCKFCNLSGADDTLKVDDDFEWHLNVKINKVDEERQQIFGVASTVKHGDYLVVDKQDDMILPEELEQGVYDFVLEARAHGDMHENIGTGRLIESMMITDEKRAAYKAAGYTLTFKDDSTGADVSAWLVGFQVEDAETWKRHSSGELKEFSIGGRSTRTKMD